MNRIHARLARDGEDAGDVEVGLDRPAPGADEVRLVRLGPVQREAVLLRIDRHRSQAELARRPHDADGDLAAVGDQEAADPLH